MSNADGVEVLEHITASLAAKTACPSCFCDGQC